MGVRFKSSHCPLGAVIEDAGPDKAIGIWFPTCPVAFPPGTISTRRCAPLKEGIGVYALARAKPGKLLPRRARTFRNDPQVPSDLREHAAALNTLPPAKIHAAEQE